MLKTFGTIVFFATIVCFARTAEAQAPAMSADDTAAYINETLHKYPTLEFVDSGCAGYEQVVAISEDRRSLIIRQNQARAIEGRCDNVQTLTVPIFSLNLEKVGTWSKQGQHSSFFLDCVDRVSCFSRRSDAHAPASSENQWFLQATAPDVVSNRLTRAMHHLVDSLLTEANAKVNPNGPFAKGTR